MSDEGGLYKNKYRTKSVRWQGYDYSQEGFYFVTICTKDRELFFGDVVNGEMRFSEIGRMANKCWRKIIQRYKNVKLDEYIVMSNHVHGILNISAGTRHVETRRGASLQEYKNKFGPLQKNSLSSIINHYKGDVRKYCNRNKYDFMWQERFYDRVIRNEEELNRIRQYIIDNPLKWEMDRNNPKNYN